MTRRLTILAAVLLLVAVGAAAASGALSELDGERLSALLRRAGPWGPVCYVALFALLEPFGVPGIAFVLPAVAVWPLGQAWLLSWLGAIGAGVVGFAFARSIGRTWVERHLPERFRRFDERLETRGVVTVVVVRLIFFLAPPAHWLLGLSRVGFAPFVLGSAVGFAPGMLVLVLFGGGFLALLQTHPIWAGAVFVAVGLVLLATWLGRRPRERTKSSA